MQYKVPCFFKLFFNKMKFSIIADKKILSQKDKAPKFSKKFAC